MKKFIFISVIVFGAFLFLSGCYTVLDLPEREYTETYEPVIIVINNPPCIDCYPPPPPPRPEPWPGYPVPVDRQPVDKYVRPENLSDLRDGGENRIPNDDRKRR